jgi:hypothetical protein
VKDLLVYYGGNMPENLSAQARVMKQWTAGFITSETFNVR